MTPPVPQPMAAATARRRSTVGALLVDIRPQVARHQGSITGAILMDPATISEHLRATAADPDREIVVCSISTDRAIPTARRLAGLGYHHVYYPDGGYPAWRNR